MRIKELNSCKIESRHSPTAITTLQFNPIQLERDRIKCYDCSPYVLFIFIHLCLRINSYILSFRFVTIISFHFIYEKWISIANNNNTIVCALGLEFFPWCVRIAGMFIKITISRLISANATFLSLSLIFPPTIILVHIYSVFM